MSADLTEALDFAKVIRIDYEDYLRIDKHSLDDELISHSVYFSEISESLALATSHRDAVDNLVDRAYAEEDRKLRAEALELGLKITETAIKQSIIVSPQYRSAKDAFLKLTYIVDRLKGAKDSMNTRGFMLRDLVSLYIAGYFSKESVKGSDADEIKAEIARTRVKRNPLKKPSTKVQ